MSVPTLSLQAFMEQRIGRSIQLLQMDVQGAELAILQSSEPVLAAGGVETLIIGTHGEEIHAGCRQLLLRHDYRLEVDLPDTREQPDGIILASKDQPD